MKLLLPTLFVDKVTDIKLCTFRRMGVKAVLLDVDNTLCSHSSKVPLIGAIDWVRKIERSGLKVYIVSNNFEKRVSSIAEIYDLPHVSMALKPFPRGFSKAAKTLKLKKKECVIIGDQIFTDVLGGNLAGMKSILVKPIELETGVTIRLRRHFERSVIPKCNRHLP